MNLQDYIETGILEKYVLGITSPQETAEINHLRKLSPEIRAELTAVEKRIERAMTGTGHLPPVHAFDKIQQHLDWHAETQPATPPPPPQATYNLLQNRTMTISIWWRCAFIAACIIIIALVMSTMYFYDRSHSLEQLLWHR